MKNDGSDVFDLIDYYYCSMIEQIYINRDRVDFNRNRFPCNFRVLVSPFRFRLKWADRHGSGRCVCVETARWFIGITNETVADFITDNNIIYESLQSKRKQRRQRTFWKFMNHYPLQMLSAGRPYLVWSVSMVFWNRLHRKILRWPSPSIHLRRVYLFCRKYFQFRMRSPVDRFGQSWSSRK